MSEQRGYGEPQGLSPAFPRRAVWGTATKLRAWQEEALNLYFRDSPKDFLAAATPGAGKTTFALRLAKRLLADGIVKQVVVVVPTEHLKKQWSDAAHRAGMQFTPNFSNADRSFDSAFKGAVVTYAQVAIAPEVHRRVVRSRPTLVILDEVHHSGDALSWGDAMHEAFGEATRRLSLTGTPFRSDRSAIPFVTYAPDEQGLRTSRADYNYSYGRALADGVVRPVVFLSYAGQMRWRTKCGEEMIANLGIGQAKDVTAQAWRTALDPHGEWIQSVLKAADTRLTTVRKGVPDAAGLVIATDQNAARSYAKMLHDITGEMPFVVLSDDPGSSARIQEFSDSQSRWLVAVRMVSEGVDIPRLMVGVYATSASTQLFFAQAIGRFVRARKRGEVATVFLPSVPTLLELAHSLEEERDHVLDRPRNAEGDLFSEEDELLAEANRTEQASGLLAEGEFVAIDSQATFDKALYEGEEFGLEAEVGSDDEADFIGLPGLLEPEQVKGLLAARQAKQMKRVKQSTPKVAPLAPVPESELPLYEQVKRAKAELNRLVAARANSTNTPHSHIHAQLRRDTSGPALSKASLEQIRQRIAKIQQWR